MPASRLSIRHQLLLLGALATASIWTGALLQYLQLRDQSAHLAAVRIDLAAATRDAEAARMAGQERGLSNGWLSQTVRAGTGELIDVRQRLDERIATLSDAGATGAATPASALNTRVKQLPDMRAKIDRRELSPAEAFAFYSALVSTVQDTAARRLAAGMIAVGLPYEHVSHLYRMAELLAQLRGLTNGALHAEQLAPQTELALAQKLLLYDDALRLYQRSAPDATLTHVAPALAAPPVRDALGAVRGVVAAHSLANLHTDGAGWWALATRAVDTLQQAADQESAAMASQANDRIAELDRRLRWTVAALVILGLVTIVLVLSTVGRIVNGLDRILEGLDAVGNRRNFRTRIDEGRRDEFGTISGSINKLIAIASSVVEEQEILSHTDPLTGAVNRRGFDQQLAARTHAARSHEVPMSVVMVDVDHFKSVNDTLGHASGDQVLKGLVQVLRTVLRPDDVLARFGGEEFVVLLPGCALAQALIVSEKMRSAIEAHDFDIGRRVTASLGVVQWQRGQTPATVIAEADTHLYAAKSAGRNRVSPSQVAVAAA